MFNNDDIINVYNDYDSKVFAPNSDPRGIDWVFPTKIDDEPYVVSIPFGELRNIYRLNPNILKKRILRVCEEQESEVFGSLNINLKNEKESFSREEIEEMIIHPTNYVIETILNIKEKGVIDRFLAQLVYLKNTNKYFIPSKVEDYIRARREELEQGVRQTELEGMETENVPSQVNGNVDIAVIEEREEAIKTKEQELLDKEKALKDLEKKLKEEKKKIADSKKKAKTDNKAK